MCLLSLSSSRVKGGITKKWKKLVKIPKGGETVAALAYIGEKSRGMERSSRGIFNSLQSQENFSPFLLISWDSVRFIQTPLPPREVLSISWDLQTEVINKNNFSTVF